MKFGEIWGFLKMGIHFAWVLRLKWSILGLPRLFRTRPYGGRGSPKPSKTIQDHCFPYDK
jgi:hypothetical protein